MLLPLEQLKYNKCTLRQYPIIILNILRIFLICLCALNLYHKLVKYKIIISNLKSKMGLVLCLPTIRVQATREHDGEQKDFTMSNDSTVGDLLVTIIQKYGKSYNLKTIELKFNNTIINDASTRLTSIPRVSLTDLNKFTFTDILAEDRLIRERFTKMKPAVYKFEPDSLKVPGLLSLLSGPTCSTCLNNIDKSDVLGFLYMPVEQNESRDTMEYYAVFKQESHIEGGQIILGFMTIFMSGPFKYRGKIIEHSFNKELYCTIPYEDKYAQDLTACPIFLVLAAFCQHAIKDRYDNNVIPDGISLKSLCIASQHIPMDYYTDKTNVSFIIGENMDPFIHKNSNGASLYSFRLLPRCDYELLDDDPNIYSRMRRDCIDSKVYSLITLEKRVCTKSVDQYLKDKAEASIKEQEQERLQEQERVKEQEQKRLKEQERVKEQERLNAERQKARLKEQERLDAEYYKTRAEKAVYAADDEYWTQRQNNDAVRVRMRQQQAEYDRVYTYGSSYSAGYSDSMYTLVPGAYSDSSNLLTGLALGRAIDHGGGGGNVGCIIM